MIDHADRLAEALRALLAARLRTSPEERTLLVELSRWILEEAARLDESPGQPPEPRTEPPEPRGEPTPARPESRGVVPLSIGGALVRVEVPGSAGELSAAAASAADEEPDPEPDARPEIDLALIATRCRLKAESCRHFIVRRSAEGDPLRERPALDTMNQLIARAKALPDCFLWAFWPHAEQPDDDRMRRIAACYEGLGEAAELCRAASAEDGVVSLEETRLAFQLFAEMSSALRIALWDTWLSSPDRDQDDAHQWLRWETAARRIFVPRHMVLDDPGDPGRAEDAIAEIRGLSSLIESRRASSKRIDELFKRARYHAGRLPQTGKGEAHDCARINESVAQLLELGVDERDRRFASLRPMINAGVFPDDAPPHPALLLTPTPAKAAPPPEREARWSERVIEARALLRGGTVVVIGGVPKGEAIERIRSAFELAEVEWVPLTEHGTGAPMRAPIVRPETRLVLVLIKLCGHLHSEEARGLARSAGKPCVILPAGYNPEQIAEQVIQQASGVLATG